MSNPTTRLAPLLAACCLLLFPLSGSAAPDAAVATDDRVLVVRDGEAVRRYPLAVLVETLGLAQMTVAQDPHFGPQRTFAGIPLPALLAHVGLADAPELLLVCADGYSIPFDVAAVRAQPVRGLLAIRDTALPADSPEHWLPFRHGAEPIDFDPFYLVWVSPEPAADLGTETLPWPFQLTEIRRFDRAAYFAPAAPPALAGRAAQEGFSVYMAHCGKCHALRGIGGSVGPVLDRDASLASLLTDEQLRDFVRHDPARFPQSKMPDFGHLLGAAEIDAVVAYLKAMQPPTVAPAR